jgi:hypothetical protein
MPPISIYEAVYGLGALVLFGVLLWGFVQYKRRNRANDPITEAATREEYDHPDTYKEESERLNRQVRPS